MTERLGDIANALIEPCRHEQKEVRYKDFADGTKHLCTQCLICGVMPGGTRWLPQDGIDMSTVPKFDDTISEQWLAARNNDIQAKLRKEKSERHLEYERYIRESDDWWAIRTKVMTRDDHLCQGCLEEAAIEVHHKNYLHLYDEILFDLVAVCTKCHTKIHGKG
ncbi:MAG: hypothetical protein ABIG63_13610 [Chloroflexota bacterium]